MDHSECEAIATFVSLPLMLRRTTWGFEPKFRPKTRMISPFAAEETAICALGSDMCSGEGRPIIQ